MLFEKVIVATRILLLFGMFSFLVSMSHTGTQCQRTTHVETVISVILVIYVIRTFFLLFESIIVAAGHSCVSISCGGDSYFCYLRLLFLLFQNVIGGLLDPIIVVGRQWSLHVLWWRLLFLLFDNVIVDLFDSIIVAARHSGVSIFCAETVIYVI